MDKLIELQAREIMANWSANRLYAGIGAAIICIDSGRVSEARDWLVNTFNVCGLDIDHNIEPQEFADRLMQGEPESINEVIEMITKG